MSDESEQRVRQLRHDLANPLAALLAETQLQLLRRDVLDVEVVASLEGIEALARRMRDLLQPQ